MKPETFLALFFLCFVALLLTNCASRPDPMPKWRAYELRFEEAR